MSKSKIATGMYIFFGGSLHPAKNNEDASRQFQEWRDQNLLGASDLTPKDGRIYVDGKLSAHVSYNGRVWDISGKAVTSSLKLAEDLDDKGVIASFTKLLLARMVEGDDVTEQLHALNHLRQKAGMKPIVIPQHKDAPKSEPKQEKRQEPPRQSKPKGNELTVHVPFDAQILPDNDKWTNRFKIKSESSNNLYTIAQSKSKGYWGCDCPGWIRYRNCKHLRALGLPGDETPFEAQLKVGSVKPAGKFKLYTGPTIVKQTADALTRAGINVTVEGTEHVPFLADGDRDSVTLKLRQILGPQWGVKDVQQLGSKQGSDIIHSDSDLSLKMEPAGVKNEPAKIEGPEAGPSNDEMHANSHPENGNEGSPVYDGSLKSPERANVNALREALETQVEMEVGKPLIQKQQETAVAEKVQDAALAQGAGAIAGGVAEVTAKPGTQIIINVASVQKTAYVAHVPGHKNSKGEAAPWVVKDHKDDHIISSHKTKAEAKKHLQDMHAHSGSVEKEANTMRVKVDEGSGLASGKEGVVIPWSSPETIKQDYPFVGGRTPETMGWVAVMLDNGEVITVPKNRVQQVKRSAEPIGGENQPGATAGHAGGSFGGTDLKGPSFHVGFTFKGYHHEASFTSMEEADKFIKKASQKFGKLAGDWTMKCPHCGKTASKNKPTEKYKCSCGWNSVQASNRKKAECSPDEYCPQCHKDANTCRCPNKEELLKTGRTSRMPEKGSPEWHGLQIAIKTLRMPDAMVGVMGGPDKKSALATLAEYGLRWDDADYMAGGKGVKKAGDGMAKTEETLEKEAGFNLFFPGQVLKEFYPEIQHEIVDYPNATNQSISTESPEIVGDNQHEIDGLVDSALDTSIVEMIQLPADVTEPMPLAASSKQATLMGYKCTSCSKRTKDESVTNDKLKNKSCPSCGKKTLTKWYSAFHNDASKSAADYVSTSPASGMGIGRDGKPEVLEGAPLRKENDIRGFFFYR